MLKWLQAWDAHMPRRRWWRKASPGHVYCCWCLLKETPGGNFRCTQKKEHDQGGVTSHTVNARSSLHQGVSGLQSRLQSCHESNPTHPHMDSSLITLYQDSIFQPNLNPLHHITLLLGKSFVYSSTRHSPMMNRFTFLNPPDKMNSSLFYTTVSYSPFHSQTCLRLNWVPFCLPHLTVST